MLDKTRVDTGAKKHTHGEGEGSHVLELLGEELSVQDCCEGSTLHLGDEEDVPHQVTHGTTQPVPTYRVCKWSGDQSWKLWL